MSHFTQLNLQGNSAGKPTPTPMKPQPGKPNPKKQHGAAQIAALAGTLTLGTLVLVLSLGTNACSKQSKSSEIKPPLQVPTTAPVAATPAPPAPAPAKTKTSPRQHKLATYKNSAYGVTFRYPKRYTFKDAEDAQLEWTGLGPVEMNFTQEGGTTLTAVQLPDTMFPKTDFTSAFFNVSVNPNVSANDCTQFAFPKPTGLDDITVSPSTVNISGTTYSEMLDSFSDHSSQADTRYYHQFQNGMCYEFTLGLQTDSTDNTTPVNRDKVFDKLQWMLSTVKIKPVAAPAAASEAVATATQQPAPPSENTVGKLQ